MVQHFYNNISEEGALSAGVGTGTAIFTLSGAGLGTMPSIPFYVRIDPDLGTEEICEVTAGSTPTSLNVTRGYDGTSAFSHAIGAKVRVCVPAEFYNKADAHVEASTNVHGLSGGAAVVGTTSTQTVTNKTINSSVIDLAHSTSPAGSQAVKVSANAATGRDGFVWDNTAGSTGRALVARSGGADQFVVDGTGIVTASQKANLNAQVEMGLQAGGTATARFITRVRPTQNAWELKDQAGFNIATVGASGNADFSGYVATASTLSSAGAATLNSLGVTNNATVGGTLGVTGASTLTGDVTLPVPAAGTTTRITSKARTGGRVFEGRNQSDTATMHIKETGEISTSGRVLAFNGTSPLMGSVSGTGVVPSVASGQIVWETATSTWQYYNGTSWLRLDPLVHARQTAAQSIPNNTWTTLVVNLAAIDSHAGFNTGTGTYTVAVGGLYLLGGGVGFDVSATGQRGLRWLVNGTEANASQVFVDAAGGGNSTMLASRNVVVSCNAGDTINLQAIQNSGGALNTAVSGSQQSNMFIRRLA